MRTRNSPVSLNLAEHPWHSLCPVRIYMNDSQTFTETEAKRWIMLKIRGRANLQETNEFEKLDVKWQEEKAALLMKAIQRFRSEVPA